MSVTLPVATTYYLLMPDLERRHYDGCLWSLLIVVPGGDADRAQRVARHSYDLAHPGGARRAAVDLLDACEVERVAGTDRRLQHLATGVLPQRDQATIIEEPMLRAYFRGELNQLTAGPVAVRLYGAEPQARQLTASVLAADGPALLDDRASDVDPSPRRRPTLISIARTEVEGDVRFIVLPPALPQLQGEEVPTSTARHLVATPDDWHRTLRTVSHAAVGDHRLVTRLSLAVRHLAGLENTDAITVDVDQLLAIEDIGKGTDLRPAIIEEPPRAQRVIDVGPTLS